MYTPEQVFLEWFYYPQIKSKSLVMSPPRRFSHSYWMMFVSGGQPRGPFRGSEGLLVYAWENPPSDRSGSLRGHDIRGMLRQSGQVSTFRTSYYINNSYLNTRECLLSW